MDCRHCRFALSSRIDGEPTDAAAADVDAHVLGCDGCRRYAQVALELRERAALVDDEPHPSRRADLLVAMNGVRHRRSRWINAVRAGLVVVAVLQLSVALPALLLGEGVGASSHMARHLGAWDVAFAIGFLVAAAQPVRVIGLLPMALALGGCMLLAGLLDVAGGGQLMVSEAIHGLELAGLGLLWALSRSTAQPALRRSGTWSPA